MRVLLAAALVVISVPLASAQSLDERMPACLACHGEKGQSENPEVPSLGGQQPNYLLTQLYIFREKIRPVALMNEQSRGLSDDDLRRGAEFLAKLPPPRPAAGEADAARMERGKALVSQHRCNSCHAPDLAGQDQIPRIAAQREDYLLKSLRDYKTGARPGYDPAMASVVQPLREEDFAALAYYIARVR
jgi:cytochrome c553